jgi:hypothetical protein
VTFRAPSTLGVVASSVGAIALLSWLSKRSSRSLSEGALALEDRAKRALEQFDFAKFQTAKGSTYEVLAGQPQGVRVGASTRRTKSFHPEHDRDDVGPKEPSFLTLYVTRDDADRAALHGHANPLRRDSVVTVQDGYLYLLSREKGTEAWGITKHDREHPIPYSHSPAVGAAPIELWGPGQVMNTLGFGNWHPGNTIVSLERKPKTAP